MFNKQVRIAIQLNCTACKVREKHEKHEIVDCAICICIAGSRLLESTKMNTKIHKCMIPRRCDGMCKRHCLCISTDCFVLLYYEALGMWTVFLPFTGATIWLHMSHTRNTQEMPLPSGCKKRIFYLVYTQIPYLCTDATSRCASLYIWSDKAICTEPFYFFSFFLVSSSMDNR